MTAAPRVFISYAHDDAAHDEAVRDLWYLLREHGVDARLDLTAAEVRQDWGLWIASELEAADFILVIASPEYLLRTGNRISEDGGVALAFEGRLIRDLIHSDHEGWFRRVLAVLLPGRDQEDIPLWLGQRSSSYFRVPSLDSTGIERLLRVIFSVPFETAPPLGRRPQLVTSGSVEETGRGFDNADAPLTPEERRALVDELATVFSDPGEAGLVLDDVGVSPARRPRAGTSAIFWAATVREMENGLVDVPYRRLVTAGLRQRPANSLFTRLAARYRIPLP